MTPPRHCFARVLFAGVMACAAARAFAAGEQNTAGPPYQATGFKVGEVTDRSAIVWTRLTLRAERNPGDLPDLGGDKKAKKKAAKQEAQKSKGESPLSVADMSGAAPGVAGEVRVGYRPSDRSDWQYTAWEAVDPKRDFTRQFVLGDLRPDCRYEVRVESRQAGGGTAGAMLTGNFRTAPRPDQPSRVVFVVTTCHAMHSRDSAEGFKIYGKMLKLDPHFFVHTGDIVYYDSELDARATNSDLARLLWWRTYSMPGTVAFHRQVSSYFEKDDHDTWQNDCWPTMRNEKMGQFTFAEGQAIFREQVPLGPSTYRTYRWGKDLQIWLVEGRDFRSPNTQPDGPEKTIWGEKQKAWFKETVEKSDATFRVLISPTGLVGPDRENKGDSHINKRFSHEGDELRAFVGSHPGMAVIHGDRHWQYHSIDPKTGCRDYSCGPCSDKHAGGWSQNDFVPEYHRYLRVAGGFLAGTVERTDGQPKLTLRFYDVDGNVRFEDTIAGR